MFTTLNLYFSPFVRRNEELHLLQIFKPLYIVLSVLGLIPCSIEIPQGKLDIILHNFSFKHSLCALFPLLVVSIFFGLDVYRVITYIITSHEVNVLANVDTTVVNYLIELVTQFTFCLVAYFCAFQNKDAYASMLREITRSWDDLPYVNRGLILGRLRVKINCVLFGALILVLIALSAVTYSGSFGLWNTILLTLSSNLMEMIQFAVVAVYLVFILMVVALLKNIEDHCRMFTKARRSIKNSSLKVELARVPVTLSQMQSVYIKALRVKRQINEIFQAPILLCLLHCFHAMVSESYEIYDGLFHKDNFEIYDLITCLFWFMLQLMKIYAFAYSGSSLKSQVIRIGRTIHNIRNSDDDDIKLLLEGNGQNRDLNESLRDLIKSRKDVKMANPFYHCLEKISHLSKSLNLFSLVK